MNDDGALQRLLDIEEIKQLRARYFRLLDTRAWDDLVALFIEDVEFIFAVPDQQPHPDDGEILPDGGMRVSRDRLRSWLGETSPNFTTVHHSHMPEITIVDDHRATARWSMTDYTSWPDGESVMWARGYGRYEEDYVRTDAGWRISRSVFSRFDMDMGAAPRPPD